MDSQVKAVMRSARTMLGIPETFWMRLHLQNAGAVGSLTDTHKTSNEPLDRVIYFQKDKTTYMYVVYFMQSLRCKLYGKMHTDCWRYIHIWYIQSATGSTEPNVILLSMAMFFKNMYASIPPPVINPTLNLVPKSEAQPTDSYLLGVLDLSASSKHKNS